MVGSNSKADSIHFYCKKYFRNFNDQKRCQVQQKAAKKKLNSSAFPKEISKQCVEASYMTSRKVYIDYVAAQKCAVAETQRRDESEARRAETRASQAQSNYYCGAEQRERQLNRELEETNRELRRLNRKGYSGKPKCRTPKKKKPKKKKPTSRNPIHW